MAGETDLARLIADMEPRLRAGEWVFCTIPGAAYGDRRELGPVAAVVEDEGLTLVVERERAEKAGLEYEGVFRMITLQVQSSLAAVGLTAAVSGRLAELGIGANLIAGYHHDHALVPCERADEAVRALERLAEGGR